MLSFFKEAPLFKYNYFSITKPGLIDTERYYDLLKGFLLHDSFEELQLPLHVAATNLLDGRLKEFNSGELIKPLLASASLTPVFSPVMIDKKLYADGGILSNFRDICEPRSTRTSRRSSADIMVDSGCPIG